MRRTGSALGPLGPLLWVSASLCRPLIFWPWDGFHGFHGFQVDPRGDKGTALLDRDPSAAASASVALLVLTRNAGLSQLTQHVVCVSVPLQVSVSPALVPQRQTCPCPILYSKIMTSPSGTLRSLQGPKELLCLQ